MKQSIRKTIAASSIGSMLEMYDFVVYMVFASVIAKLFFPNTDHFISMLAVFTTFAVGYLSRPIGAVIIGHITDRYGRKKGLTLSITAMGLAMFLIAILPTYQHIGKLAAIILILCRILQGLSVGGEFASAATFIAEHAPRDKRAIYTSWIFWGINSGLLLAMFVGYLLNNISDAAFVDSWGWRIAFLIGALLAIIGFWVRRNLQESPVFIEYKKKNQQSKQPFIEMFTQNWRNLIKAFLMVAVMGSSISAIFIYMPHQLIANLGFAPNQALLFNCISLLVFVVMIPIAAYLCDRIGQSKEILFFGSLCFALFSYPLYGLLQSHDHFTVLWSMVCLGAITAFVVGPMGYTLTELFKSTHRTMGVGVSYNFSFAIFGGFTPLALTAIIHYSNSVANASLVMIVTAIISGAAILCLKRRNSSSKDTW